MSTNKQTATRLDLVVEEGRKDIVADPRRTEGVHPHVLQPERELHRVRTIQFGNTALSSEAGRALLRMLPQVAHSS